MSATLAMYVMGFLLLALGLFSSVLWLNKKERQKYVGLLVFALVVATLGLILLWPLVVAPTTPVAQAPVVLPAAVQLVAPTQVPVTPTEAPAAVVPVAVPEGNFPDNLFESPVVRTSVFNTESSWLIAEPGVLLDNTAAWTIPGTSQPWFINVPEGGFTYFSLGHGTITIDGVRLELPGAEGLNYLVVIRGRIDDTIVDNDLNETAEVTDFTPGHAIWSIMPPGAYVSRNWFRQQLVVSTTTGGTNCGATGCSLVKVVLFDVDSHFYQMFDVHAGSLDNWTLVSREVR